MKKMPAWRRYLRFWRADIAADVDEELRFHADMRVQEYRARGMTEDDARRTVMARLGDVDAARSECIALGQVRETYEKRADFFDGLRADVRFALHSLGRSPGWTAVALLTIALGVGATTTVFSVADALLVRPFPYPDASRIYIVRREFTMDGRTIPATVPFAIVPEWRTSARTIEAAVPFNAGGPNRLGKGHDAITVNVSRIDTGFLAFAGAHPLIGRNVTGDEMAPGGPGAMLLTEQFWRRQYGASPTVLGTVVELEGEARTIVGVVPASLSIPYFRAERADVLVPVSMSNGGQVMVRLTPGASKNAAVQELDGILKRSHVIDLRPVPMPMVLRLTRPQDALEIRQALEMLTGAVALLMLVACTNIAHLLLARGAARRRELAVRHALGAGRSRLVRQLVTESVVLAVIGGALAVLVGWAGLHLLTAARPATLVALSHVSTDRGILSITSVLALSSGLTIGLLAALRTAQRDLGTSLRIGASSTSLSGSRLRASLVIGEVALSATLLVGALLLVHAVFDLQRTQLGFDARGLYAVSFSLPEEETRAERASLVELLRQRAPIMPGVERVTLALAAPGPRYWRFISAFETPERPATREARESTAMNFVAPDYFSMMGIPLLAGQTFDEGSVARHEVIVSTTLARQLWPDGIAVGRRFRNTVQRPDSVREPWQTVIGVVPDVTTDLLEGAVIAGLYRSLGAEENIGPGGGVTLIVRSRGDDPTLRLKQFAASVQPNGSEVEITNVRDRIEESMAEPRFTMRILATFAALGVLLAAIGLFGVISYNVGQRTREIGVRMTLGASRTSIARLVVGDGIRLALLGIAIGLLGAVAATRLIQSMLYGVSPFDPFSFGVGATLLLAVSVVACVVPMLRATGVDPVIAVRVDS